MASVCMLVSITASPKHPQSETGSAMAIHTVIAVIAIMKSSIAADVALRLMAKSMNMPSENSTADSAIDEHSVSQSGA